MISFFESWQGAGGKVSTMKREVEALEKKIKNLTKSFHIYCKIKGEQSSSGTIELVNDHLKKRTCCRFICQDIQACWTPTVILLKSTKLIYMTRGMTCLLFLQLWEVDDLQNRNGHHNIVLNYHGFISQRFLLLYFSLSKTNMSEMFHIYSYIVLICSLTLNTGQGSSTFVANKLNDMNISKVTKSTM